MSEQPNNVTQTEFEALKEVIDARFSSLKAWGAAAFVGGQALAGLIGAIFAPHQTAETAQAVARALPFV